MSAAQSGGMSDGLTQIRFGRSGQVAWLVPRDALARDDEQRLRLIALQVCGSATAVLAQAREELAYWLTSATRAVSDCDFAEVGACARQLRRIGLSVGFPTLARAAEHVENCLGTADAAALGATVARLHRLGALALVDLSR